MTTDTFFNTDDRDAWFWVELIAWYILGVTVWFMCYLMIRDLNPDQTRNRCLRCVLVVFAIPFAPVISLYAVYRIANASRETVS